MSWGLWRIVRGQWLLEEDRGNVYTPAVSSLRGRFLWNILWGGERGHKEVQAAACNEVLE